MAFWNRTTGNDDAPEAPEEFQPQPEKARRWFDHGKTAAMSSNFAYALECYANGIRLDPGVISAHEAMFEAAVRYVQGGGKPAAGKEIKSLDDGTPIGRFTAAEFEWMKDLNNYKSGIKLLEAAGKTEQLEFGNWIAPRIFALLRGQRKHSKSGLITAMQAFRDVGAWELSLAVGEMAKELDPTNAELDAELKNLSAERAMQAGGYESRNDDEGGGFRGSIKDADKQKELIEQESLAIGEDAESRNLARAKAEFEESPDSPDLLNKYAQLLRRRGTPESIQEAMAVYDGGYERTGEYRFKMQAGDLRIAELERELETMSGAEAEERARELLVLKAGEYEERVKRYPTDRVRKFDLGVVHFELGNFDEAMAQFQKAKDEPRLRVRAGHLLGRCFLAENWYSDAAAEFDEALQAIDATEKERELGIKYDLMVALLAQAAEDREIEEARRAKTICSEIARTDITYRDIRAKRKEVDDLIRNLSAPVE